MPATHIDLYYPNSRIGDTLALAQSKLLNQCIEMDRDVNDFRYGCDLFELGFCKLLNNHVDEAEKLLKQADALIGEPATAGIVHTYGDLHSVMAFCAQTRGDFDEAIREAKLARDACRKFDLTSNTKQFSQQVSNLEKLAREQTEKSIQ